MLVNVHDGQVLKLGQYYRFLWLVAARMKRPWNNPRFVGKNFSA